MVRRHRADKQTWWKVTLKVLAGILVFIGAFYCFSGIINLCVNSARNRFATSFAAVNYEAQLTPTLDDEGYYTFTVPSDREFKVVQLTDVHIGGGYWSYQKDKKALTAVATMLTAEKPDLVVVTGDLAYPVPFQAGTFDNKASAASFAKLMETLGIYWTIGFGNHDTEAYSYYDREDIYKYYTSSKNEFKHCLLTDRNTYVNGDDVTVTAVDGVGNQVIKIVDETSHLVEHAVIVIDSHAYGADDPWGVKWGYDYIKQNQIDWYEYEINKIHEFNKTTSADADYPMFTSTAYFHIPLFEMRDAYKVIKDSGVDVSANAGETLSLTTEKGNSVTYFKGTFGEDPEKKMVYCSETRVGLFAKMIELGSTKAIFNGHDHLNNLLVEVDGIDLVYGMSIDYLAYTGIQKYGNQRGCTVISINKDGFVNKDSINLSNYYDNYTAPAKEKEKIIRTPYY